MDEQRIREIVREELAGFVLRNPPISPDGIIKAIAEGLQKIIDYDTQPESEL